MAHTCPDCGEACYCGGDFDDILLDDELGEVCVHRGCQWDEADDEFDLTDIEGLDFP